MTNFLMSHTIPKKARVAMPFPNDPTRFEVVAPEEAFISVFDRSFHFGDSVYEVVRTYDGVLFGLDEHFGRMKRSMEMGYWTQMPDFSVVESMMRAACKRYFQDFGNEDVYIRITASRGIGDTNIDIATSSAPYATVIVKAMPAWPEWHYTKGVDFWVVDRRRNPNNAMPPAMKSGNYLNNILAITEAKKHGASDAVMLSVHGFVTEGTTNNLFIVRAGEIWTAPLEVGILEGLTRRMILKIAADKKISAQERLYTAEDLRKADEVFLSSTTRGVVPVTKVDGQPIAKGVPGPLSKQMHEALRAHIQSITKKGTTLFV